ncbi:MAG: hypothetical protein HOC28_10690 [Bacteroidetes Order II. Incertae sedis bacterium]|nr:hypothetical protein [Bacteroidetes Order II. bacterium]
MMKSLRESTKYVMILLLVSFGALIFLEWGMDYAGSNVTAQSNVGEVNGQGIRYDDLKAEYDQLVELERQQRGGEVDEFTTRRLVRQVWDRRVSFMLLQQEVVKNEITVSDAELIEAIRENPPEFIQQQEMFQTDGTFDRAKYLAALNNPNVQGWELLEAQFRALLPQQKLIDRVMSAARITDLEVKNSYIAQNEKIKVKYLFFGPNDIPADSMEVAEEEVQTYYDSHQADFQQEARTRVTYIKLDKAPSTADEQRTERQINDLYKRLTDGEDFEQLARDFSEDGSAENGGDLGFFGAGMMVKEFEEVAFATSAGTIAPPVKSMFGWHIIKVEEKKSENNEPQVRARHILLKTAVGQQTLRDLDAKATSLLQIARESGLDAASASTASDSLEVVDTGLFAQRDDGFIPRIGYLLGAASFSANENVGAYSEVLENDSGYHILNVSERKREGVQALDEVATQVRLLVNTEKRKLLAKQSAEAIKSRTGGNGLAMLTGTDADLIEEPEAFARMGFIPGIGQDLDFMSAAFSLDTEGAASDVIEGGRGYYLIELVEKLPIDEDLFETQKDILKQQMLAQEQNQLYADWLAELKGRAEIVDRLSEFFTF